MSDTDFADDHVITQAEAAALEFEPWQHTKDEWRPPTNEEWKRMVNPELVCLRTAWAAMFRTKAELIDGFANTLSAEAADSMFEGIAHTRDFFEVAFSVLEAGETRLLCAASAYLENEDARASSGQAAN